MAHMWMMMAAKAEEKLHCWSGDSEFLKDKLHTAEFFFELGGLPQSISMQNYFINIGSLMSMPMIISIMLTA